MTSFSPSTTILFIDSHKQEREFWAQRLNISSSDYVILEANTGKAGVSICQSQRVDCVVTELDLSDMSGFKVLLDLVESGRYPPVIILSRLNSLTLAELAIRARTRTYPSPISLSTN